MRIRLQKGGQVIGSPGQVSDDSCTSTETCQGEWEQGLTRNPGTFHQVKQQIKEHFDQAADHFTAAVLARVTQGPQMKDHVRRVGQEAAVGCEPRNVGPVAILAGLAPDVTLNLPQTVSPVLVTQMSSRHNLELHPCAFLSRQLPHRPRVVESGLTGKPGLIDHGE